MRCGPNAASRARAGRAQIIEGVSRGDRGADKNRPSSGSREETGGPGGIQPIHGGVHPWAVLLFKIIMLDLMRAKLRELQGVNT